MEYHEEINFQGHIIGLQMYADYLVLLTESPSGHYYKTLLRRLEDSSTKNRYTVYASMRKKLNM